MTYHWPQTYGTMVFAVMAASTISPGVMDREVLVERLFGLWERTGHASLGELAQGRDPKGVAITEGPVYQDWVSTGLMDAYKDSGDSQVFGLLYEMNADAFRQAIAGKLRRSAPGIEAGDVLQEVFLNIYRYPNRFLAEKADSFRNWGFRIVRNTLLKFLKVESKRSRQTTLDEDLSSRADRNARTPYRATQEAESARSVDRAYLLYLNLYLVHFEALSLKERTALTMVEVDGASYKEAAAALGIRLENLKMVIFRGRRKILRGMSCSLAKLEILGSPGPGLSTVAPLN